MSRNKPGTIEEIDNDIKLGIISYDKVASNSYRAQTESYGEVFIKFKRRLSAKELIKDFGIASFYYYLGAPLKREAKINSALLKINFHYFRFPPMIYSNYKNYIVFKYISASNYKLSVVEKKDIVSALLEFQSIGLDKTSIGANKKNKLKKGVSSILRSVTISTLKGIVFIMPTRLSLSKTIIAIKEVFKMVSQQKKIGEGMLIHKDLDINANYIITPEQNLYFIDFEMVINEKRWIMTDVVDLAWDAGKLTLDRELIETYIEELGKLTQFKVEILSQIRLILLRKAVFLIRKNKSNFGENRYLIEFISRVLLDEKTFEEWYIQQKNITMEGR